MVFAFQFPGFCPVIVEGAEPGRRLRRPVVGDFGVEAEREAAAVSEDDGVQRGQTVFLSFRLAAGVGILLVPRRPGIGILGGGGGRRGWGWFGIVHYLE